MGSVKQPRKDGKGRSSEKGASEEGGSKEGHSQEEGASEEEDGEEARRQEARSQEDHGEEEDNKEEDCIQVRCQGFINNQCQQPMRVGATDTCTHDSAMNKQRLLEGMITPWYCTPSEGIHDHKGSPL